MAGAALGCDAIPDWSLGQGAFTACTDASDIACTPFAAPTVVAELEAPQGSDDEKPTLTSGMLEIYFLSDRDGGPGGGDVWRATRETVTDPWSAPELVAAVNGPSRETSPAVSSDGTTLWVGSDRDGGAGGIDIWVSMRADAGDDAAWSDPVPVVELNSPGDEIPRPPGDHGLVMPLSRRADADAPYQVFSATRSSTAPLAAWSAPVAIASVNTAGLDDDGFLTDDGLTLYFSSDRLNGTQDLFVTERSDLASPFASPVPLASLNRSTSDERDPWVSPDGHEIYFTSDRLGELQIFHATR
jgi:hypothetical protein